jgi:hypothetical protein
VCEKMALLENVGNKETLGEVVRLEEGCTAPAHRKPFQAVLSLHTTLLPKNRVQPGESPPALMLTPHSNAALAAVDMDDEENEYTAPGMHTAGRKSMQAKRWGTHAVFFEHKATALGFRGSCEDVG